MTILIAHRGNVFGPKPERENCPDYIRDAFALGFHVEVDVWGSQGYLFLGHDQPLTKIPLDILENANVWLHCKNHEAVALCFQAGDKHYFWHENDQLAITSRGFAWVYPGQKLPTYGGIAVKPDGLEWDILHAHGICSDYIYKYL